ncbi:MAG TPA: zinc-binding alcohol dehydrogenase family protein [Bryobacteraceae bacterium]|nr:zinc-binding alcohol dehydrogenase family protein [Bryobacteraceae bacterium]
MRALILQQPGSIHLGTVAEPKPNDGEVLLRIRMVGLCGTDLNSYRGKNPLISYPRIPGHEISARVEALGPGVPETIQIGQDVTLSPYTACGRCASCRRGRVNACQFNQTLGVQRDGALAEFLVVPWTKLLRAEGLTREQLCMVEPLSVGFHAAQRGRVEPNDTVAVLGCGMIGLGAIAASAYKGSRVIAVDVDDRKLDLAKRMGAHEVVNSKSQNLHEVLSSLTEGLGPDVVIEAIGLPETFRAAVDEVAFTGRVVYVGYAKEAVTYETRFFVMKELDILGSRNALQDDFAGVIQMLSTRSLPLSETVSKVVPISSAPDAFAEWAADPASTTKVLVAVD